jgi:hypothetical protein
MRRAMKDFPPLAWFTSRIDVPKCLLGTKFYLKPKSGGEAQELELGPEIMNTITLNRLALGFPITDIPVIPWPQHYGYRTAEGESLNETARDVGDNPNDWYVSEVPVDVAKISEAWGSKSRLRPKLERTDSYVNDIRRMVEMCRKTKGVYIPPTWLARDKAEALARSLGVPVGPV